MMREDATMVTNVCMATVGSVRCVVVLASVNMGGSAPNASIVGVLASVSIGINAVSAMIVQSRQST